MPRGRTLRAKIREVKALEKAKIKAQQEMEKKRPLDKKVTDYLKKLLDKVNPLEAGAILSLTFLLYNTITPIIADILGLTNDKIKNEAGKIALAFAISYIFVRHFGGIAQATATALNSLTNLVKWFVIGGMVSGATGTASILQWWQLPLGAMYIMDLTFMPFGKETTDYYAQWITTGTPPKFRTPSFGG